MHEPWLQAQGIYRRSDLVGRHLIGDPHRRQLLVHFASSALTVGLAMGVIWLLSDTAWPLLVFGGVLAVLYPTLWVMRRGRQQTHADRLADVTFRLRLDDAGLTAQSPGITTRRAWHALHRVDVSHDRMVLWMVGGIEAHVLPRHWTDLDDDAWAAVSHRIRDAAHVGPSAAASPRIDSPWDTADDPLLATASGQLTIADLVQLTPTASRMLRQNREPPRGLPTAFVWAVLGGLLAATLGLICWLRVMVALVALIGMALVLGALVLFAIGWALRWLAMWLVMHRVLETTGPQTWRLTHAGLIARDHAGWTATAWDRFAGYCSHNAGLALLRKPHTVLVLPRRWDPPGRCKAVIHVRLGKCTRCGYALRGSTGRTCPDCGTPIRAPWLGTFLLD